MAPFLAMTELKRALFCSFGLTKTLDFILRFLAMTELKRALFCSFGLTKTLFFFYREKWLFWHLPNLHASPKPMGNEAPKEYKDGITPVDNFDSLFPFYRIDNGFC